MVKDTSLAANITVTEMFMTTQRIVARTYESLALYIEVSIIYLLFCEDLDGKRSAQNLTSSWGQMAERYGAELVSIDALSQCVELLFTGRTFLKISSQIRG